VSEREKRTVPVSMMSPKPCSWGLREAKLGKKKRGGTAQGKGEKF